MLERPQLWQAIWILFRVMTLFGAKTRSRCRLAWLRWAYFPPISDFDQRSLFLNSIEFLSGIFLA